MKKITTILLFIAIISTNISYGASYYLKNQSIDFSGGKRNVRAIVVDLNKANISIEAKVANNKIGTTLDMESIINKVKKENNNIVGAINGTYFSAYDGVPLPWGTIQIEGKFIHIGNTGAVIGFDENNKAKIENLFIEIKGYINDKHRWYSWNINHTYDTPDAISIFTPEFGEFAGDDRFTSIVIEEDKVSKIAMGKVIVPKSGYVIVTGHEGIIDRFTIGDKVTYECIYGKLNSDGSKGDEIEWNMKTTIGAGPTLIRDGNIVGDGTKEGFVEDKINKIRAQRSFIGVTYDNILIAGTVSNVTIKELAEICKKMWLYNAINLDGGASSGLYYEDKIITKPSRQLSNIILIRKNEE